MGLHDTEEEYHHPSPRNPIISIGESAVAGLLQTGRTAVRESSIKLAQDGLPEIQKNYSEVRRQRDKIF